MGNSPYGKLPSGNRLEKIKKSKQYKDGAFRNLSPTEMMAEGNSMLSVGLKFIRKPKYTAPEKRIESVKTNLFFLPEEPTVVWFGHSSYLLQVEETRILVDPLLSGYASPYSFMVKAFPGSNEYSTDDFPALDAVVITHDHYDHLDFKAIRALDEKVNHYYVSLGVGAHLEYWGIAPTKITELDWWENASLKSFTITATPARHFSGRGTKRGQSLWSSFVLQTRDYKFYLGGDSGYDSHFAEIGKKFGPFDLAILECGQYNFAWPQIHMMPEETAQAAVDLGAKLLLPVHWGKFSLALHPWREPIERVSKKAQELNIPIATPRIGEMLVLGKSIPKSRWWE